MPEARGKAQRMATAVDSGAAALPLTSRCLLLCGPTAVGKSEIASLLATRLSGEVISVDSMQVYRGLDVGTAKPSTAERVQVPHHLIDVVDLTAPFDAAQFVRLAQAAAADILRRGKVPILCGGTGLYFKGLLQGLGQNPAGSPELRAELEKTPLKELLQELASRDPVTYERIDRENPRRVIRALEVIRLTGKPFSGLRADWKRDAGPGTGTPRLIGLSRTSSDLRHRIEARVEEMFQRGLVAETERLLLCGLAENRTATQALGYRQVIEYLNGVRSLADTIELVKIRTWQFAKRQLTWFRRQLPVDWISIAAEESADRMADRVEALFTGGPPAR